MFHLLFGTSASLADHPALHTPDALVIEPDPLGLCAWWVPRSLLAALRAVVPAADIDAALAPHRGVLSLVLRGLALTPEEAERREAHAADPIGFMTHNGLVTGHVTKAWTLALAPLVAGRTIVIPTLAGLDHHGFLVIQGFQSALPPEERPTVVVAVGPGITDAGRDLWTAEREGVLATVALAEGLAETRVERISPPVPAEEVAPSALPGRFDPLDDALEIRAWASGDADLLQAGAEAAFRAYGFTGVLRLGLRALDLLPPGDAARRMHRLVALAAYNRQVRRSDQTDELPALLEAHFEAALAGEEDPAVQSHLYYRLAINTGRRKGDLDQGIAEGTRAIELARDPRVPRGLGAFLEAWARNGRAFSFATARRGAEAMADCEAAWEMLAEAEQHPGAPTMELLPTRAVLADNLARVSLLRRDHAAAARWQRELEAAEQAMGGMTGLNPIRWLELLRHSGELAQAHRRGAAALTRARAVFDPIMVDLLAAELAELCYRLGDAPGAVAHYTECLHIRERISDADDLRTTRLSRAVARLRAGQLDVAAAEVALLLQDEALATPAAQAQLLALSGRIEHAAGRPPEAVMSAAIEAAVESGDRDTLAHVARIVGDISAAQGDAEEAAEAFERALAIAGVDVGPPPAGELLAIHLGRAALGVPGAGAEALAVAPAALAADPEAWWSLSALEPHLDASDAADAVRSAIAQRAEFAEVSGDATPA